MQTDIQIIQEEIQFLADEISSLKARIAHPGSAAQFHKLEMLKRLKARCERSLAALEKRAAA